MLINNEEFKNITNAVRFINYTNRAHSLCSGNLTLEIEGKLYTFGHKHNKPTPNFAQFWRSSGCAMIYNGKEIIKRGEWLIDVKKLPKEIQKYAIEIDKLFNENVKHGCCGGCI